MRPLLREAFRMLLWQHCPEKTQGEYRAQTRRFIISREFLSGSCVVVLDHQIIQELTSVIVLYNCVAQRLWADRSQTDFLGWTPPSAALPIPSYATCDKVHNNNNEIKNHTFVCPSFSIYKMGLLIELTFWDASRNSAS